MEDFAEFVMTRPPTAARPLMGLTVLVVEDSRFACEAMRLLCLRSGARIRRADSLRAARRHLRVYRPAVVIVDLGLPDGSGLDLISDLAAAQPRMGTILATSGDPTRQAEALAAGACGFLVKPIETLGAFQETILAQLPAEAQPPGPRPVQEAMPAPDPVAYRDDMAHAADLLSDPPDAHDLAYLAQFLTGVARSAGDTSLETAAEQLCSTLKEEGDIGPPLTRISAMVQERLVGRHAV